MREFESSEGTGGVVEEKSGGVTRREFLEMSVAATLAVGAEKIAWAADTNSGVPRRPLGRTGEKVSMVGLGGYHIGNQKDEQRGGAAVLPRRVQRGDKNYRQNQPA